MEQQGLTLPRRNFQDMDVEDLCLSKTDYDWFLQYVHALNYGFEGTQNASFI